ncbi:hypothetical protein LDENG_00252790, partial [Lucifuga dentata]
MEPITPPGNSDLQCTSCRGVWASGWCLQCDEALCDSCVSAHRRVTVTRSHDIVNQPPAGVFSPVTRFCHVHPSEPLKLFCSPCQQLTCRDCQLMAHKNHRYLFLDEALGSLKQQLDSQLQRIRAQKHAVSQSLQDMEARLQEVEEVKLRLQAGLRHSFFAYIKLFQQRIVQLFDEAKKVCQCEVNGIEKRKAELQELQQQQEALTELVEEAKNINNVYDLLTYTSQVEAQLTELSSQGTSPPPLMSEMKVVADAKAYNNILSIGSLEVSMVPFSVSQPDSQNTSSAATGNTQTATSSCSASDGSLMTIQSPPPSWLLPHKPNSGNTSSAGSAGPANHLAVPCSSSSSWLIPPRSSSQKPHPPGTAVSMLTSSSSAQAPPSSAAQTNQNQLVLNFLQKKATSASLQTSVQAGMLAASPSQSCFVPGRLQPSVIVPHPSSLSAPVTAASSQTAVLLTNGLMYQTSYILPSDLVQVPLVVEQRQALPYILSVNTCQTGGGVQQNSCRLTGNSAANASQLSPANQQQPPVFQSIQSMIVNHRQSGSVTGRHCQPGQRTAKSNTAPSVQKQPGAMSINPLRPAHSGQEVPADRVVFQHWKLSAKQRQSSQHQKSEMPPSQKTAASAASRRSEALLKSSPLLMYLLKDCSATENKGALPDRQIHQAGVNSETHNEPFQTVVHKSENPCENCDALTSPHHHPVSGDSAAPEQQQSQIVKAFADSACDRSTQQLSDASAANQQEPGENEPTSTVSEPEAAAEGPCTDLSECSNAPGNVKTKSDLALIPSPKSDCGHVGQIGPERTNFSVTVKNDVFSHEEIQILQCLSGSAQTLTANLKPEAEQEEEEFEKPTVQPSSHCFSEEISSEDEELSDVAWRRSLKARVSLFRLPISPPPAGQTFPRFRLVPGDARDELYLQEINEDSKLYIDDIMDFQEPLSSPESLAVLQIVICCTCGCANGSVVCMACGRGFHRGCHIPPIGPGTWSAWICSLCQDLSDPSDPYSSERRCRPSLELLQQRKCEKLLLNLLVEGCAELCLPSE